MSQNQTGTRRPIPGPNDQTPRTVEEPVNRQSTRVLHVVFVLAAVTSACATGGDKAEGPLAAGSDLPAPTTIPTSSSTSLQASTPTTITTTIPTTTEVVAPVSTQPPQSAADEDLAPEVDPIGDAFQESFDREHPFLPLHRFCTPLEPPETAPADMESGITEQMLTIVQIRTLLDELTLIGMTIPADETSQALEAFADLVNRECGGIHGRRLDLRIVDAPSLGGGGVDLDTLQTAACLEATEQMPAVIVLDLGGLGSAATRCVAVEHDVAVISTSYRSKPLMDEADGRLLTIPPTAEQVMRASVAAAQDSGLLEGATIAVLVGDTAGQPELVDAALVTPLRWLGYQPVLHLLGCEGSATCRIGSDTAVSRMIAAGTDVVFTALNLTTLPRVIGQMVSQGMPHPLIIQSGFNGQGQDLAAQNVASYSGPDAGSYYDGSIIVAAEPTGASRLPGYLAPTFDSMCNQEYARAVGRPATASFDPASPSFQAVVSACSVMRIVARAVYDAGPDPRRRDVLHALEHLGPVDVPGMLPATSGHGKQALTDVIYDLKYRYPCQPVTADPAVEEAGCIIPLGGYRPLG